MKITESMHRLRWKLFWGYHGVIILCVLVLGLMKDQNRMVPESIRMFLLGLTVVVSLVLLVSNLITVYQCGFYTVLLLEPISDVAFMFSACNNSGNSADVLRNSSLFIGFSALVLAVEIVTLIAAIYKYRKGKLHRESDAPGEHLADFQFDFVYGVNFLVPFLGALKLIELVFLS